MRGNAARDSHNVTHEYTENGIDLYVRARSRECVQPVSQVHYTAESRASPFPTSVRRMRDHTDDGSLSAKLLTPGLHPFLVNGSRPPLRAAAAPPPRSTSAPPEVLIDQEMRSRCAGRGNKSSNRRGSRSDASIPMRRLPCWERGVTSAKMAIGFFFSDVNAIRR